MNGRVDNMLMYSATRQVTKYLLDMIAPNTLYLSRILWQQDKQIHSRKVALICKHL